MKGGIFLLFGSNQGLPKENLAEAKRLVSLKVGTILKTSSVYITAAWGEQNQADFYNQVIEVETELSPQTLLDVILSIENKMGRVREKKWGPRIIDIDILLYQDVKITTPQLTVPHPGIPDRMFTLKPLSEIASGVTHPVLKKTIAMLLNECRDPLSVHVMKD